MLREAAALDRRLPLYLLAGEQVSCRRQCRGLTFQRSGVRLPVYLAACAFWLQKGRNYGIVGAQKRCAGRGKNTGTVQRYG